MDANRFRLMASIFLGPSVRNIVISNATLKSELLLNYAPSLATQCPLIETIEFETPPPNSEPSLAMSQSICAWSNLRSVKCGPVDVYMLHHLRNLPSLHSLGVYTTRTSHWLSSDSIVPFDDLDTLTLDADSGDANVLALERLLGPPPSPSHRRASVRRIVCGPLSRSSIHSFARAVERLCSDSLAEVSISNFSVEDVSIESGTIPPFDALRHLTSFRNLRSMELRYYDDSLAEIGSSSRRPDLPSSFSDLIELTRRLPQIRIIGVHIEIGSAQMSLLDTLESEIPTFGNVEKLWLSWNEEEFEILPSTDAMGALLFRFFPHLSAIVQRNRGWWPEQADEYWEGVCRVVQATRVKKRITIS
ncbi:hypothetical protein CONPUDRAFT_165612 [Coniophora puteana RWD-64-598 SS2]|uniref:F-box domain-containing protein n=1 Tax=Coniophora puteana (strain RWD-64-598) TaxID=741705 RepID=A0A5M3MRW1_CONPW|nr:uncharacterized protein CONPUDRAFT_165612 [Coniophora puteana RWD-64-598 SS2]EIW81484.1 hypothetical protein CONPUDRAFT_165612 [Coniophora puteana RWD-64-598 SS2]